MYLKDTWSSSSYNEKRAIGIVDIPIEALSNSAISELAKLAAQCIQNNHIGKLDILQLQEVKLEVFYQIV